MGNSSSSKGGKRKKRKKKKGQDAGASFVARAKKAYSIKDVITHLSGKTNFSKKELNRLYRRFARIGQSTSHHGTVTLSEFVSMPEMMTCPYVSVLAKMYIHQCCEKELDPNGAGLKYEVVPAYANEVRIKFDEVVDSDDIEHIPANEFVELAEVLGSTLSLEQLQHVRDELEEVEREHDIEEIGHITYPAFLRWWLKDNATEAKEPHLTFATFAVTLSVLSPLADYEAKAHALFNALDRGEKGYLDWNDLFQLIKCSTGNCFGAPSMFQNRNVVAVVSSILHMTRDEDDEEDDDMRDNQMTFSTFAHEVMRHLDIDNKMSLQF